MDTNVADLYRGQLEDFIARRTTMTKALRAHDPAAAAAVAKLRKPSVSAWAIDQVAAEQPGLIAELLAAGADARAAQASAGEGEVDAEGLREAVGRVRHAVDAVAIAAGTAVQSEGRFSDGTDRRIRMTLRAAATGNADDRVAVWQGTLDHDLEPAGFALGSGDDVDAPELAAAIAHLRRERAAAPQHGSAHPAPSAADAAAARAEARRAGELQGAARRARAVASAKRDNAVRLANAARLAEEEAAAAERAADIAEAAAPR